MKTYNKPKVYLISEPKLNWEGINDFFKDYNLSWTENANNYTNPSLFSAKENKDIEEYSNGDKLVEFGGRICYVSFGKKQGRKTNKEYIDNILSSGHGSVLEHANYSFLVSKVSRGFTHEMVRHRAGMAYSQESTHYIDYSPETGLMNIPEQLNEFPELKKVMEDTALKTFESYKFIYDKLKESDTGKKVACSIARQILPTGIESKLVFTGNIRALRHFIEARANKYNVKEIRDVAIQVYDVMKDKATNCFSDMEKYKDEDGLDSILSKYKKV